MENFDITKPTSFLRKDMLETLRLVIDPELHINIIDLGLVYDIEIDGPKKLVKIKMTLSSPHCPMGESIVSAVKNCIEGHYTGFTSNVELVWEPVWSYHSITEEGKRLLGI